MTYLKSTSCTYVVSIKITKLDISDIIKQKTPDHPLCRLSTIVLMVSFTKKLEVGMVSVFTSVEYSSGLLNKTRIGEC